MTCGREWMFAALRGTEMRLWEQDTAVPRWFGSLDTLETLNSLSREGQETVAAGLVEMLDSSEGLGYQAANLKVAEVPGLVI